MSEIEMEIRGKKYQILKVYWPKRQTYGSTIIHAGAGKRQIQTTKGKRLVAATIAMLISRKHLSRPREVRISCFDDWYQPKGCSVVMIRASQRMVENSLRSCSIDPL
ncbi:hypothetical protein YC2023_116065 [Brassica napus]